ncbi:acyltransferase [Arthrobacter sp. 7749]|nr:acyltransferase [Arthrobacter sp. 7749]
MSNTITGTKFRLDIQGLRAIAVGLVVIYHLLPQSITGGFIGVDVFFVISGYLITSHLVKHPPSQIKDLGSFWLRRVKRLLPAAMLVLLSTVVAVRVLTPESFWRDNTLQAIASAFYSQNWYLLKTSVDYLAEDNAPTAVQHYWSLAVEEQFYLIWPIFIAGLVWFAAKQKLKAKTILLSGVVFIVVVSGIYSVYLTSTNPSVAYFSTFTRAWELAAGAVVALLPRPRPSFSRTPVAALLAWAGLAGIVVAGIRFDAGTAFPGYAAALPVFGTALVIWVAATSRVSPNSLLSSKPFQFLGAHSYSIYLWHWPLLVLVPFVSGPLGTLDLLAIAAATIVLSMLSKKYVEDAFRKTLDVSRYVTPVRFLIVGTAVISLIAGGIATEASIRKANESVQLAAALKGEVPCFGASVLHEKTESCAYNPRNNLILPASLAKTDKSDAYKDGCWSNEPYAKKPKCTYGTGKTQVALVGNSHAGHWLPALQRIADENDWTITTFLVSRCNPTDAKLKFDAEVKAQGCSDYGQWVLDQTSKGQFDFVITSERQSVPVANQSFASTEPFARAGYKSYLKKWAAAGTPIVIIRDTPFPGATVKNIPDCVAVAANPNASCSGSTDEWQWMDPLADAAGAMKIPNVEVVDPTRYFCQKGTCPAVIGGTVVYFDGSHITASYAATLSPYLEKDIVKALKRAS